MDEETLLSAMKTVSLSIHGLDTLAAIAVLGETMVEAICQHCEDVVDAKAMLLESMVAMNESIDRNPPGDDDENMETRQ